MRIGLLLTEAFLLLIITFIYCCLKISSKESRYEEENL